MSERNDLKGTIVNTKSGEEIIGSRQPMTYELTNAQYRNGQRFSVAQPWVFAAYFVAGGLAFAAAGMGILVRHHLDLVGSLFLFAALLQLGSTTFLIWSGRRIARSVVVSLDAAGLHGTLDGRKTEMPWSRIRRARDADDSFVLHLFGKYAPVVLPTCQLSAPDAFWALLRERLGARGHDSKLLVNRSS